MINIQYLQRFPLYTKGEQFPCKKESTDRLDKLTLILNLIEFAIRVLPMVLLVSAALNPEKILEDNKNNMNFRNILIIIIYAVSLNICGNKFYSFKKKTEGTEGTKFISEIFFGLILLFSITVMIFFPHLSYPLGFLSFYFLVVLGWAAYLKDKCNTGILVLVTIACVFFGFLLPNFLIGSWISAIIGAITICILLIAIIGICLYGMLILGVKIYDKYHSNNGISS